MRGRFDVRRLAESLSAEDVDTRVWVCVATVDDDPDAYEVTDQGVYVDVTTQPDGKPLRCRWGLAFVDDQGAAFWPPVAGMEVVCLFSGGDENEAPVCYPSSHGGSRRFPQVVNGRAVDGTFPFVRVPGNRDWEIEVGGVVRIQGDSSAPRAAREGDPVRVTVPPGTFLVAADAGVLNPDPVDVDGTITGGSSKVRIGG